MPTFEKCYPLMGRPTLPMQGLHKASYKYINEDGDYCLGFHRGKKKKGNSLFREPSVILSCQNRG